MSWIIKNAEHWRTDDFKLLEKTLESPLDCKEIKPVSPKGNQPWIFIGRPDAEAPILWPPYVKSWLIGKDLDAGKDWRQKEKGSAEGGWLGSIADSMAMNLSKLQEIAKDRGAWYAASSPWGWRVGNNLVTEQQHTSVMVNFMCQHDWVIGYPDIWLNIVSGKSVKVFLDGINICEKQISLLNLMYWSLNRIKRLSKKEFFLCLTVFELTLVLSCFCSDWNLYQMPFLFSGLWTWISTLYQWFSWVSSLPTIGLGTSQPS